MQEELFDKFSQNEIRKLSHRDDPVTSKNAIDQLVASGSRDHHMRIVLDAVIQRPGSTAPELMVITELDEYQIRRRLTDLKNKGEIERGQPRPCSVKGTSMCVWSVV